MKDMKWYIRKIVGHSADLFIVILYYYYLILPH